jgi:hypothetical protein
LGTLTNPRHELFAQHLASGKTAKEAYVLAGYKPNRGNAAELNAKQSISNRVAEIQARNLSKQDETVQVSAAAVLFLFAPARGGYWRGLAPPRVNGGGHNGATLVPLPTPF